MKRISYCNSFARLASLCVVFLLITSTLFAQRHTTARNMGLGGGGTAYMGDYHANFINPANLMLGDRNAAIGLFGGISTLGGGNLADMSIYNEYFTTGRTLNEQLTMEISDKLFGSSPNGSRSIGANLDAVLFGINLKKGNQAVSAAFRMRALSSLTMSKGFFELSMGGLNELYFNEYKNVDVSADMLMVGEVSVGYAREVWSSGTFGQQGSKRLYAGVSPKLLLGMNYYRTSFQSQLRISENEMLLSHVFDYNVESTGQVSQQLNDYHADRNTSGLDPVFGDYLILDDAASDLGSIKGRGLGLDMGVTYEMVMPSVPFLGGDYQVLRLSLSATDMGSVNFSQDAGSFRGVGQFDWSGTRLDSEYIDAEHDSKFSNYSSHLQDSIATHIYGNYSPEDIASLNVGLSPMLNFGAAYTAGKWNLMFDLGKGMNSRGMNSQVISSVLGVEYNLINIIPLRTGMRVGGDMPTAFSFGTGINLKFLDFTVGFMSTPNLHDNNLSVGAAWSGLVMRF